MDWLQPIKQLIEFLWFLDKTAQWERGVRFTYLPTIKIWRWSILEARVIIKEVGPGIHRKVPWLDELDNHSVVPDPLVMEIQNITMSDGTPVSLKASVMYKIFNVVNVHTKVHDYEHALKNLMLIHASRVLRQQTFEEVYKNAGRFEEEIKKAVHAESKEWGIRIEDVGLTTFVKSEQFNRFQIGQQ